jgi:hypothetical protein
VLLLRQVGLLTSPFILWALTRTGHGGRLHFALSTSRRVSPLRERPSLKLASAAGLFKLCPAISRNGTRRSFEHAAHGRSLIPLSVARSRADSTIRNS